jgi:hypothetical protein
MHPDIPTDIAVNIKDKLRRVRHALRRGRQSNPDDTLSTFIPFVPQHSAVLPEIVLNRVANVAVTIVDKALTSAEAISLSLISTDPAIHHTAPDVQSLRTYFGTDLEGQRAFRRDMYYLVKAVLHSHKVENILIREAAFQHVYAELRDRHSAALNTLNDPAHDLISNSALLCTLLFQAMLHAQPVRAEDPLLQDQLITGYAAISLACALATAKPADMEEFDNLESALQAVEVRSERIINAVQANDQPALQNLFATLISHLP